MDDDFTDIFDFFLEQDELQEEMQDGRMIEENPTDGSNTDDDRGQETSEEEATDYESDSNEGQILLTQKGKRGRPVGWRKEENEERPVHRKRVKRCDYPVEVVSTFMCCMQLCAVSLPENIIRTARDAFQALRVTERSQYILDWIRDHSSLQDMQWSTAYLIGNKEVCLNSFLCILNFPKSTFYQIRKRFIEGKSSYLRPGRISGFMGPSANYFVMWINNFASKYADKLPDSFKFHLPCCLTKSSIHQMMCQEALFVKVPPISYSHMMTIWRKQLAHIKIPKKTRFSQCDTCLKLKDKLATCQDKVLREELIKKRKKHLINCRKFQNYNKSMIIHQSNTVKIA